MSSEAWQPVRLSSDLFRKALDRYIDFNKPDPISRKQLEGWSMQWYDANVDTSSDDNDNATSIVHPSHKLQGRLEIAGEFLLITLHVRCAWKSTTSSTDEKEKSSTTLSPSSPYGHFVFTCHAMARFWTKAELANISLKDQETKEDAPDGTRSKNDQKIQDKIRTKMMARLRDDAYISKLLVSTPKDDAKKNDEPSRKGGSL